MERLACIAHGDLARRLALGRLDDATAMAAEASLAACPSCQAWWEASFAPAAALDPALTAGLRTVVLPARRPHHPASWLSLAATVVLSVGVGTLWLRGVGRDVPVETASIEAPVATTVSAPATVVQVAPAPAAPVEVAPEPATATARRPAAAISTLSFEAGAVVVASADPTPESDEVISAMSFESGALQVVGSST